MKNTALALTLALAGVASMTAYADFEETVERCERLQERAVKVMVQRQDGESLVEALTENQRRMNKSVKELTEKGLKELANDMRVLYGVDRTLLLKAWKTPVAETQTEQSQIADAFGQQMLRVCLNTNL